MPEFLCVAQRVPEAGHSIGASLSTDALPVSSGTHAFAAPQVTFASTGAGSNQVRCASFHDSSLGRAK